MQSRSGRLSHAEATSLLASSKITSLMAAATVKEADVQAEALGVKGSFPQ